MGMSVNGNVNYLDTKCALYSITFSVTILGRDWGIKCAPSRSVSLTPVIPPPSLPAALRSVPVWHHQQFHRCPPSPSLVLVRRAEWPHPRGYLSPKHSQSQDQSHHRWGLTWTNKEIWQIEYHDTVHSLALAMFWNLMNNQCKFSWPSKLWLLVSMAMAVTVESEQRLYQTWTTFWCNTCTYVQLHWNTCIALEFVTINAWSSKFTLTMIFIEWLLSMQII